MFWRFAVPLIIAGVFAMILLGWAVMYWRQRRDEREDMEFEREVMEHEKEMERDGDS